MKIVNLKKILIIFSFVLTVLFACVNKSVASDYQYKVLDPKYNPQAQALLDGKLQRTEDTFNIESKGFDASTFFALFALVLFPMFVISFAIRIFKRMGQITGKNQKIGYIKIFSDALFDLKPEEIQNDSLIDEDIIIDKLFETNKLAQQKNNSTNATNAITPQSPDIIAQSSTKSLRERFEQYSQPTQVIVDESQNLKSETSNTDEEINLQELENARQMINKYFSSPIEKSANPLLLNTSILGNNKGLCLVEYNRKYSLIGYINSEIFLLEQFDSLKNIEIRSRFTETKNNYDRYIVKIGEHKSLIETNEEEMKLLLDL